MAHGADGIADLMRDAGTESPERRELRLLQPLGENAGVLQKNQDRSGILSAEWSEMRFDRAQAIRGHKRGRIRRHRVRTLSPGRKRAEQSGMNLTEQRTRNGAAISEHLGS